MDNEFVRKGLLKKLKELNVPQADIDKALLDFDALATDITDPKTLEKFAEQLVENVAYKNNIAPSDGMEEYKKIFPEIWGTEPPSDEDIEDFFNEEIGNPNEEVIENPDGSTTRKGPGYEVNTNVPIEEFTGLYNYKGEIPEVFDDLKGTTEYSRMEIIKGSVANEINSKKFAQLILNMYDILGEYAKDLSTEDKKLLVERVNDRTYGLDEKYKDIVVIPDEKLSLEQLNKIDNAIADLNKNFINELPGLLDEMKLRELDYSSPDSETILEQMDNQETSNADRISQEYSESIEPRPGEVDNFVDNEFNQIIANYQAGDLTDEEVENLKAENEQFKQGVEDYDNTINEAAANWGIKDTDAFKKLVMAGTKILQAIDEELLYSPILLAEKGLQKLGLGAAAEKLGAARGAALAWENIWFRANVGIAALGHTVYAATATASRLPREITNGVLGLYGAGMPEGLVPEVKEGDIPYEISHEEQMNRHKVALTNQFNLYSDLSPVMATFKYLIGPQFGITDPIQGYQSVFDRIGKMLGGND